MRDDRCKKTLFHCLLSASTLHKNLPGTYITCRFLNFDRATLSSKNLEWWDFCLLIKLKALQGVMKYFNSLTTSLSLLDDIFQSVNNNLNIFPRIPNNLGTACLTVIYSLGISMYSTRHEKMLWTCDFSTQESKFIFMLGKNFTPNLWRRVLSWTNDRPFVSAFFKIANREALKLRLWVSE